jgi:transcriptional regulator with XRE-family HTH domain
MASDKAICNDFESENYYEVLEKCSILDIGKIIKEIRKKNDITQDELAQRVGTKRAYISRIEKDASNVRLSTLVKILEKGLSARINLNVES